LEIDVPSLEKQRDLVDYVDRRLASFKKLETTLESQAAKLERLKLSLLNAAFTGQLLEDN
jgi:restriction endonuclease S subunit